MFDLDKYLADLILNCRSAFGDRLLYMGLQGSCCAVKLMKTVISISW